MAVIFDHGWPTPSSDVTLHDNEVHVWRVSLDPPASYVQNLRHLLSSDEVKRADRFRFQKDRIHFTVARGVLRRLLGQYLTVEPQHIRFQYNAYGKPELSCPVKDPPLKFNLSHSGELALYAFTYDREVGIDIEWVQRRLEQAEQIAARFFSVREYDMLRTLPEHQKHEAFFHCWTRKEAYIKARGKGLTLPLHQFDVSLIPGEPAKLLATRDDPKEALRWTMQALKPGPDYIAALIVEGDGWDMQCWQWVE